MITVGLILALAITGVESRLPGDSAALVGAKIQGPVIEIWSTQEVFRAGDAVQVWMRSSEDAQVAVLHVDPDGMVHVLYPHFPWEENSIQADRQVEIVDPTSGPTPYAFHASDYPGMGFLFAVAGIGPLNLESFAHGDYWSYQSVGDRGRVVGDPYLAFLEIVERIAGEQPAYYDVFPYHVGNAQSYPRFLCYDCHAYAPFESWNPYERECGEYRLVIFDAPQYYPTRLYPATRIVYADARSIDPRFVFTERADGDPGVTVVERSTAGDDARALLNPVSVMDRRARGTVPVPVPEGSVWKSLINWISVDRGHESSGAVLQPDAKSQLEPQGAIERLRPRLQRRIPNSRTGVRVRRPSVVRPPQQPARKPPAS